jgi:signal transduction histidine kinase
MYRSVRVRLTASYVGILAFVLIGLSLGVYAMMERAQRERIDAVLQNVLDVTALSLDHEIEEHEGRAPGEESFRGVLKTMHHRTFPRQGIAVFRDGQIIAIKPGEGELVPGYHDPSETPFHTTGDRRDAVRVFHISGAAYQIVAAERLSAARDELRWLRQVLTVGTLLALAVITAGGWYLAQRSLAPAVAMSRRLEASIRQQKQFMADASHELRTPISVSRTAAEVTLESEHRRQEDYREALDIIKGQMSRLSRIVQDMFTLAQADAGVYPLQGSLFYLDELLRECVRAASLLGSRRGVTVEMAPAAEAPCHGDESLVRQLAMILLDNGVKYTPEGGIVSVTLQRQGGEYALAVSDTGAGIPPEARAHVFERFYRVDKARSRASAAHGGSGSGLGLAIGQWIASAHRGRLELTASGPDGSVFTAYLPAPAAEDQTPEYAASSAPRSAPD